MQVQDDPRFVAKLPITITGIDQSGHRFRQTAYTADVSRRGARLSGVPFTIEPASTIEIEYRSRKAHFRVVWMGNPDASLLPEAGVVCIDGACIWGQPLPGRPKPRGTWRN